jgi:hypothetical protein
MAIESDNTAERLARIDKLNAEMKPSPVEQQTARPQVPLEVVQLPQGPALAVGCRTLA